jgi:hypothetical protein
VTNGGSILIRDGTFTLDEQRADGAIEVRSRYVPSMRFAGVDTVFEKPNRAELAAAVPPARRQGQSIHAPVTSEVWRTLLRLRAARAVTARRAADERRRIDLNAHHVRIAAEEAERKKALYEARLHAPEVTSRLVEELSGGVGSYVFEDGRIYLDDVLVAELIADPKPRIRIFEGDPLDIVGRTVVPRDLLPSEHNLLSQAGADERRTMLTRIIRERFRDSRERMVESVRDAGELLVELGMQPELTRDGLSLLGQLEVPYGARARLDDLHARYCGKLLLAAVAEHIGSRIQSSTIAQDGQGAVVVSAGSRQLARIDASGATIDATQELAGSFLGPGQHWSSLLRALAETFPDLEIDHFAGQTARLQVIKEVPLGIAPSLAERCLEASRAIRTKRNAAFGNPVSLSTAGLTVVTFFPVRDDGEPYVPIVHERGEQRVKCHLRITGTGDPLTLVVRDETDDLAGVWALSLLGFATLTVVEEPVSGAHASRKPRSLSTGGHKTRSRGFAQPRTAARMRYISRDLEPTGITRTAHWVVGHIRLLRDSQNHTPHAAQEARRQGITLRGNQTWVRPHVRGLSSTEPLTFRWRLPHEALSLIP